MPIAVATMPPSAIGVSMTRCSPYLRCRPSVARNTPPKYPMSSPIKTTAGFLPSMMSMAEFRAWIMFMLAMRSAQFLAQQGLLAPKILRHILEHVLEHGVRIQSRAFGHGAELDRFLPAGCHQRLELGAHRLVP